MSKLKPWHTLAIGIAIGYVLAKRGPSIKIPVLG